MDVDAGPFWCTFFASSHFRINGKKMEGYELAKLDGGDKKKLYFIFIFMTYQSAVSRN